MNSINFSPPNFSPLNDFQNHDFDHGVQEMAIDNHTQIPSWPIENNEETLSSDIALTGTRMTSHPIGSSPPPAKRARTGISPTREASPMSDVSSVAEDKPSRPSPGPSTSRVEVPRGLVSRKMITRSSAKSKSGGVLSVYKK
jgi:hypothetical protein